MLRVTWRLVDKWRLDIPCDLALPSAVPGPDGKCYSRYGLGQPLAAIPFYLLGKLTSALIPGSDYGALVRFFVARFNQFLTALTGVLLFLLAGRLYRSSGPALVATCTYALATMAWPYARFYFSEPLTAFCLLAAFYALFRFREEPAQRWLFISGCALGYAVLTRLSSLAVLPFLVGYLFPLETPEGKPSGYEVQASARLAEGQARKGLPLRSLSIYAQASLLGPVAFSLGVMALYNWRAFGHPFATGYAGETWSVPLWQGLYGLLFSPGKSLFLFNPPVLLSLPALVFLFKEGHRREAFLFASISLVYLFLHAGWWTWHGGWSWGPRFLLPSLPFLVLPLGALWKRGTSWSVALEILWIAGIFVALLGVLVDFNAYMLYVNDETKVLFEARLSPLLGHLRFALEGKLDLHAADLSAFGLGAVWLAPLFYASLFVGAAFMFRRTLPAQKELKD